MKYYKILKINNLIKNPRLKFLGIYFLHIFNQRYLAVHFDPVNACNLRCKMCYFTDKEYVKKLKGIFGADDLPFFARAVLGRALKLQVGCGTEPTLYKDLDKIFLLASEYKVPHISLTTNANLIEKEKLELWASSGLDEIIVSLHGVYKTTYENFMGNADFDRFMKSLHYISEVKKKYPDLKLRINYTFNEDNFDELKDFKEVFKDIKVDALQIRPITSLGDTEYQNFSLDKVIPNYDETYQALSKYTKANNILFIAPTKNQLTNRISIGSVIREYTYCYISPKDFWREDFNWKEETFNSYSKRKNWGLQILKQVFASQKNLHRLRNKLLNYEIT